MITMEESTRLTDSPSHRRRRVPSQSRPIYVDDESSTDSGCSSRGSSESSEKLSRRGSSERLCDTNVSSTHGTCYLDSLRSHHRQSSTTRSQERLPSMKRTGNNRNAHHHGHHHHHHHHHRHHSSESLSHSSSPSDAQSSDSDSPKRPSKTEVIRRALQCLKIAKWPENGSNHNSNAENSTSAKEKKQTKKSPRRILRDPVSYTYVRGLSGLPTQRVPRTSVQQVMTPCSCHDTVGLYR